MIWGSCTPLFWGPHPHVTNLMKQFFEARREERKQEAQMLAKKRSGSGERERENERERGRDRDRKRERERERERL